MKVEYNESASYITSKQSENSSNKDNSPDQIDSISPAPKVDQFYGCIKVVYQIRYNFCTGWN